MTTVGLFLLYSGADGPPIDAAGEIGVSDQSPSLGFEACCPPHRLPRSALYDADGGPTEGRYPECAPEQVYPGEIIQVGIRLHLAGLSLSNSKRELEKSGVSRSRTAIHDWVQKAGLEPAGHATPAEIGVDETVIRVNGRRCWLSAAVDTATNQFLHGRLFPTLTTQLTIEFFRELRAKHRVDHAVFLVDTAPHLRAILDHLDLDVRVERFGHRNAVERVFREVKRRTSSLSNAFRNAAHTTAESWLQAFAVWWNQCQS